MKIGKNIKYFFIFLFFKTQITLQEENRGLSFLFSFFSDFFIISELIKNNVKIDSDGVLKVEKRSLEVFNKDSEEGEEN
jgi:hypothetical protein